jgi:hypothetical protein
MLIDMLWRAAGALSGALEHFAAIGWSVRMAVPRPHRRRS